MLPQDNPGMHAGESVDRLIGVMKENPEFTVSTSYVCSFFTEGNDMRALIRNGIYQIQKDVRRWNALDWVAGVVAVVILSVSTFGSFHPDEVRRMLFDLVTAIF